jgi:hypothetical protein
LICQGSRKKQEKTENSVFYLVAWCVERHCLALAGIIALLRPGGKGELQTWGIRPEKGHKGRSAGLGARCIMALGWPLARDYRQHHDCKYYRVRREARRRPALNDCADEKKCSGKVPCDDWTVLCFERNWQSRAVEIGLLYCY